MVLVSTSFGGKYKLDFGGRISFGENLTLLLNTAMEAMDLDDYLDSRLVLLMPVGPDCHSGVRVASKLQFFSSKLTRVRFLDAPRHK